MEKTIIFSKERETQNLRGNHANALNTHEISLGGKPAVNWSVGEQLEYKWKYQYLSLMPDNILPCRAKSHWGRRWSETTRWDAENEVVLPGWLWRLADAEWGARTNGEVKNVAEGGASTPRRRHTWVYLLSFHLSSNESDLPDAPLPHSRSIIQQLLLSSCTAQSGNFAPF